MGRILFFYPYSRSSPLRKRSGLITAETRRLNWEWLARPCRPPFLGMACPLDQYLSPLPCISSPLVGKAWCTFPLCLGSSDLFGEMQWGKRECHCDCGAKLYPPVNFISVKADLLISLSLFSFFFGDAPVFHVSISSLLKEHRVGWGIIIFNNATIFFAYTQWFSPDHHLPLPKYARLYWAPRFLLFWVVLPAMPSSTLCC